MISVNAHGGGAVGSALLDDTGLVVAVPDTGPRRYLFVKADVNNVAPIFLRMHQTAAAVVDAGIVLYPGDWHEWTWENMYWGPIRGIVPTGNTAKLFWHEGK